MSPSIFQLRCSCNEYPWGVKGTSSLAARLCAQTPGYAKPDQPDKDFTINEDKIYSEMWFGTYLDLPTFVKSTGENLQDVIDKNPDGLLGKDVIHKMNGSTNLPFLPKVLANGKALPLQIHPNKSLAAKLHKKAPSSFTDPNHKPEIAIALSDFEAFVGLKPLASVQRLFSGIEALKKFIPSKPGNQSFDNEALRSIIRTLLLLKDEEIKSTLLALSASKLSQEDTYIHNLIPRLQSQHGPADPGHLVALLTMNYITLKPYQSLSIPADGIHAYLSGDCIECMARSNNMLMTGFCPTPDDATDVDEFVGCLTFTPHSIDEAILKEQAWDGAEQGNTVIYRPDMDEFNVLLLRVGDKNEREGWRAIQGPNVIIVTKGKGVMFASSGEEYSLDEGFVYFIGKAQELKFESRGDAGLEVFGAFVE